MKKIVSALLIVLMLLQTVSFATVDKIYMQDETQALVGKLRILGIFDEFDQEAFFGDNYPIKRSEAAVVISKMLGIEPIKGDATTEIKFFDVPQYCEYVHAVDVVTDYGIMSANENGMFMPEAEMKIGHVIKCMVVALGYGWKAEKYGGYPQGYVKVASDLDIINGVKKGIDEVATRADFLKFVDVTLDKPICKIIGFEGDNIDFEIDEDINILSEYHDIYIDEDVVQNNNIMTISNSTEGYENSVFIGNKRLCVNNVTEVYSYVGLHVEFYYKKDTDTDENNLLLVFPTNKNTVTNILKDDFYEFENNNISYKDTNGRKRTLKLDDSVAVLNNGELANNVSDVIKNYEGLLKAIDNNADNLFDVVVVRNYTYDKVKKVKIEEDKIYTESKVIPLDNYEKRSITLAMTGEEIDIEDITPGDVIGFAESTDKEKLIIEVIGTGRTINIYAISGETFTSEDGIDYDISLLKEKEKALIKPGTVAAVVVMDGYYAVWADVASEAVSLGYLIQIGDEEHLGNKKLEGIKILGASGSVEVLQSVNDEKLILNGKSVKVELLRDKLRNIKIVNNLGGDGEISQLIAYKTNEEGKITNIYTVESTNSAKLYLKYGYKNRGKVQIYDDGYDTARFGLMGSKNYNLNFSITPNHPIFKVPAEGQEQAPDTHYATKTYTEEEFSGNGETGNGWMLDSYVDDERSIIPRAVVVFAENASSEVTDEEMTGKKGTLVLVEKSYVARDSQGEMRHVVQALYKDKSLKYYLDDEASATVESLKANPANPNEKAGLSKGDVACIAQNNLDEVIKIHKVYDCETRELNDIYKPFNGASEGDTAAYTDASGNRTDTWVIEIWSAYNLAENGQIMEVYEGDLTQGIPGEEKRKLYDIYSLLFVNKKLTFYDEAQERVYHGGAEDIVDYHQDPSMYTTILVRHTGGWIYDNQIFYNYNK